MRTISIINQKGGCGKTTTAINLAGVLARRGYRTLLVDLDPQAHCAAGLAIPEQRIEVDIADAMLADPARPVDPARLLWRVARNLDLAPARMRLAGLEAARGGLADAPDKERRLACVLQRLAPGYDACLVDCSPAIGLLTYNALVAADSVLVPVETSYFALQGASRQVQTIRTMSKRLGAAGDYWLVATIHDEGSVLARDLLDELRRRFGDRVAPVVIRRDGPLKEAASFGQPVIEYAPASAGAGDYEALADWFIGTASLTRAGDAPRATPKPQVPHACEPATILPELKPQAPVEPQPGAPAHEPPVTDIGGGAPPTIAIAVRPAANVIALLPPPRIVTRAEDLARRVKVLQLRVADERLRRVAALEKARPARESAAAVAAPAPPLRPRMPGARCTPRGVVFTQPLSIGRSVAVAGAFNAWSSSAHELLRDDAAGVFELTIPLPPGRYSYRLVIDGRWTADPFNEHSEPNPFGEINSVLTVPEPVPG